MSMKKRGRQFLAWLLCVVMLASTGAADLIPVWATELSGKLEDLATGSNAAAKDEEETEDDLSATASNATPADAEVETDIFDLALPSQATYEYRYVTDDGITVIVEALDCIFDEGTTVKVKTLTTADMTAVTSLVKEALPEGQSDVSAVYAYDISFWCDDEEFEPDGEVKVTFQFPEAAEAAAKPEQMEIFHVADEMKAADIMPKVSESQTEVACMADGFSVYGVARVAEGECIEIWNVEDLRSICDKQDTYGKTYKLMSDINLEGINWVPIGISEIKGNSVALKSPFNGTFDGNGYTIKNMSIDNLHIPYIGLFARVYGGTLKNVILDNINIDQISTSSASTVGGLVGEVESSDIINCMVTGKITNVTGVKTVAGIIGEVGYGSSIIDGCISNVNISIDEGENIYTAGIAVASMTRDKTIAINNCINLGDVAANTTAAGIVNVVGNSTVSVTNCINKGKIISLNSASGILEQVFGYRVDVVIENCVNKGEIISKNQGNAGGIISADGNDCNMLRISQCYNEGAIRSEYEEPLKYYQGAAGGIIGECESSSKNREISNCFNCGTISNKNSSTSEISMSVGVNMSAGGIIGRSSFPVTVRNCYNAGKVENDTISGGGPMIGANVHGQTCFENSYYLDYYGEIPLNEINIPSGSIMCTIDEMEKEETYSDWDFENVWTMGFGNYPYPVFQWMTEEIEAVVSGTVSNPEELKIKNISIIEEEEIYNDSDIEIVFDQNLSAQLQHYCGSETFQIRDYFTDKVVYEWTQGSDYKVNENIFTLRGALTGCVGDGSGKYYIYIPAGFFSTYGIDNEGNPVIYEGTTDKDQYAFIVGLTDKIITFYYTLNGVQYIFWEKVVPKEAKCPEPNDPVIANYIFSGWYDNPEFIGEAFDFSTPILRNYSLYAKLDYVGPADGSADDSDDSDPVTIKNTGVRDSGFQEQTVSGKNVWLCCQNGEYLTGYHTNLYYDGQKGSFFFSNGGFMLTGWYNIDGVWRYFDENPKHLGFEVTIEELISRVNKNSAYQYLSSYNYAGAFANDLDFVDATLFFAGDYDAIKRGIMWQLLSGEDQFTNNKEWAKKYLLTMIEEFGTMTENAFYDPQVETDKQVTAAMEQLAKISGYDNASTMYDYLKDTIGDSQDAAKSFDAYKSNINMLNTISKLCPSFKSVVDEVIADYTVNVAAKLKKGALDKLADEFSLKNAVDTYNELTGETSVLDYFEESKKVEALRDTTKYEKAKQEIANEFGLTIGSDGLLRNSTGTIALERDIMNEYAARYSASTTAMNGLIVSLFKETLDETLEDDLRLGSIENVIYSAYVRSSSLEALRVAEKNLVSASGQSEAVKRERYQEYAAAFNMARAATILQYDNMATYYGTKGENNKQIEVMEYADKLRAASYYNY